MLVDLPLTFFFYVTVRQSITICQKTIMYRQLITKSKSRRLISVNICTASGVVLLNTCIVSINVSIVLAAANECHDNVISLLSAEWQFR